MRRGTFWRGAVLAAGLAASLGACSVLQSGRDDEVQSELNRQRRRWRAQGIDDYAYRVARHCFCPPSLVAPVVVEVRDGSVVGRAYVEDGAAVDAESARFWPAVEGLFDVVQDALDRDADSIEVEYHPELGYPTSVRIDYEEMAIDEELGLTASDLQRK